MRVHRIRNLRLTTLSALIGVILLAAPTGATTAVPQHSAPSSAAPANCPVTPYSAAGLADNFTATWYGRDHLWAGLEPAYQGVWYAGKEVKVQWRLPHPRQLAVTGSRLDAAAPPLQVSLPTGYTSGFQPSSLLFPTAGCWKVTGRIPGQSLHFVVLVHSAADSLATAATPPPLPSALRRPLALPSLADGGGCPRSGERLVSRVVGGVLGNGPVHLQAQGDDGTFYLGDADTVPARWLIDPSYQGPLLVRGRQLGTTTAVQFGSVQPAQEVGVSDVDYLRTPDWRLLWIPIQVPGPGCYAIQVDGLQFSEVIVFAVAAGSPAELAATPQP